MKNMNKILLIIMSFLLVTYTYAEEEKIEEIDTSNEIVTTTGTSERSEANNYGVNKEWTIDNSNLSNILNTPLVDASLKVYDYSNVLSDEEENKLRSLINEFTSKTNMEIVILTVDQQYSYDEQNEEIASDFYDYNDFGLNTKFHDGIILIRNTYEEDPFLNIYTFGEGQLYFDYDRCENILDTIFPYIKGGKDYFTGMKLFIEESTRYYNKGYDDTKYYLSEYGELLLYPEKYKVPYFWTVISGGVASVLSVLGLSKKNKMVMKATEANDYIDKSKTNFTVNNDTLVSSITTHHIITNDSSSGGSGGGFSHMGSSGGFHGGGGGRHG